MTSNARPTCLSLKNIAGAPRNRKIPSTASVPGVFSQADEDGIIQEILRRLGLSSGNFCEYGVGDGLECNTLTLAGCGWRGFWISGQDIAFQTDGLDRFFRFDKQWVTLDNVAELFRKNCTALGFADVDVLSFDLDSNDLFYVASLLEAGTRPGLFAIVEYNVAKSRPPLLWSTRKEQNLVWQCTDYMGASLQSFVNLFDRHGYMLVCCNAATGANAFFVRKEAASLFADVPADILDLYMTPNFRTLSYFAHPRDARTARRLLEIGQRIADGIADPEFG